MRLRIGLAVAVIVAATGTGIVLARGSGLPDDAAFRYDGEVMTVAELDHEVDTLHALYGVQEPKDAKERDTFRRDIAKAVAVSLVLDRSADEHDIVISDKAARDTMATMIKSQLGDDPQRSFTEILTEFGVSEGDVLREVKRQQAIARLFQEITEDEVESVTPEDVRAYFDRDPSRFATPETRHLRNIVVATEQDAEAVLAQARGGADFRALARRLSLDDATRGKGGDLGTVAAAELDPAYAKVAFAADGLFGPVQTEFGWNVGQVVSIVPATTPGFDEVKDHVTDTLRSEKALAAWRDWLSEQIRKADVEYAEKYLPEDPDEPPSTGAPAPVVQP